MTIRSDIIDNDIVVMYVSGMSVSKIASHFDTDIRVIYKRLYNNNIQLDHKILIPWTSEEESQLIDAWRAGATGREYIDYVPNRSQGAIKSHLCKLRSHGKLI